ncbi:Hypothetical protein GLP15_4955 [Giardia lamblia P15]|uniref:Uncharacterized protein n=1 Tax=Giardia intestinalis (strain P15) TaxID=658858 RepID=E1F0U0_GIAIA|nr:Hypothetical protein GLP15_4955 [Giardia lamblia P15]
MSTLQRSSIIPLLNVHGVLGTFSVYTNPSKKEILLDDGYRTLIIHADGSVHLSSSLASANAIVYPISNNINTFFSFSRQTGLLRYNDKDLILTSSDPLLNASAAHLSLNLVSQYVTHKPFVRWLQENGIEHLHVIVGYTHISLFTVMLAKEDTKMKAVQRFSDFDEKLLKVVPLLYEYQGKTDLKLWTLFETGKLYIYNIDLSVPEILDMVIIDRLKAEGIKDIYCHSYTLEILLRSRSDVLYYLSLKEPYTYVELTRLHPDERVIMGPSRTPTETTFFIIRFRDKGLQTQVQWMALSHNSTMCVTIAETIYPKVLLHLYSLDTQISTHFYDAACLAVHENGDIDLLFSLPPSMSNKGLSSKLASLTKEITGLQREIANMQARSKMNNVSPAPSPRHASSWANVPLTSLEMDVKKCFNQTYTLQTITLSLKAVYRMILIQIPPSLKLESAANGLLTDLGLLVFLNTSTCEFSLTRSQKYLPFKQLALSVAFFPSGSGSLFEPFPVYLSNLLIDGFEQIISPLTTGTDTNASHAVCARVPCTAVTNTKLYGTTDTSTRLYITDGLMLEVRLVQNGELQLSGDSLHLIIQAIASATGQQYSSALLRNTDYCTSLRLEENILRSVRLKSLTNLMISMDYYSYISLLRDLRLGADSTLAQYSDFLLVPPKGINAVHVALVGASTRMEEGTELALIRARTDTSILIT